MKEHAWRLWAELAGAPVGFGSSSFRIVVSPESLLCPPGWVGLVELAGAAIVTVPDQICAGIVRAALDGLPATAVTDPAAVRRGLAVVDMVGPATLSDCDARPEPSRRVVRALGFDEVGSQLSVRLASPSGRGLSDASACGPDRADGRREEHRRGQAGRNADRARAHGGGGRGGRVVDRHRRRRGGHASAGAERFRAGAVARDRNSISRRIGGSGS